MNKQGSIVLALLLVLVLSILSAGILLRSVNENKIALRTSNSTKAFWAAEAGIQKTIWEINNNSCVSFVQQGTSTPCVTCTNCGGGNKTLAATLSNSGDYDVILDNGNTLATSTGSSPDRTAVNAIKRNVQATLSISSPFSFGVFSQGQINLANNTFIDSYNSNNGAYSVNNSATNGSVGTNGTTAGIITIGNNISLGGSVSTGAGGTVTVGSNSIITGTTTHTNNVSLPNVAVPSELSSLSSAGVLSASIGQSISRSTGDYKYTSMDLNNNSTLTINGNVRLYLTEAAALTTGNNVNIIVASGGTLTLYVDGVLSIPNNVTLTSSGNVPKNFQVYSTYTGTNGISINNNGLLALALYAPQTDVSIGNNDDLFGSIIGKAVTVNNNSAIHYDETLANLPTLVGTTGINVWQEI